MICYCKDHGDDFNANLQVFNCYTIVIKYKFNFCFCCKNKQI